MEPQFEDLDPATKKYLKELREDDIEELRAAAIQAQTIKIVARFVRWLVIGTMGIIIAASQFGEGFAKILRALKGGQS